MGVHFLSAAQIIYYAPPVHDGSALPLGPLALEDYRLHPPSQLIKLASTVPHSAAAEAPNTKIYTGDDYLSAVEELSRAIVELAKKNTRELIKTENQDAISLVYEAVQTLSGSVTDRGGSIGYQSLSATPEVRELSKKANGLKSLGVLAKSGYVLQNQPETRGHLINVFELFTADIQTATFENQLLVRNVINLTLPVGERGTYLNLLNSALGK